MKILIASDMEGATGVVDWDHVMPDRPDYPRFCRLLTGDINAAARERPDARRWKDIWSAGHSVSGVADVPTVAELIERTAGEYRAARRSVQSV